MARDVRIDYTNWRGEREIRRIRPLGVMFWGNNEWHQELQWLFLAIDVVKGERRTFALSA